MPSTYSTSLGLELIGNGEQAGTWGTTTNNNLGTLLEQAITGVQPITLTGGDYTLTDYNGLPDQARNAVLVFGGLLAAPCNVIAPAVEKTYIVRNFSNATVTVKTASGNGISISNAASEVIFCNGTDFFSATQFNYIDGNLTVTGDTTLQGSVNMSSTANSTVTIGAANIYANSSTGQVWLPRGNTAVRTSAPIEGIIRYNTEAKFYEGYANGSWIRFIVANQGDYTITYVAVGGGGGGGSSNLGGGGGGAGQFVSSTTPAIPGTTVLTITIGAGGSGSAGGTGATGTSTVITGIASAVGGGGGASNGGTSGNGFVGGTTTGQAAGGGGGGAAAVGGNGSGGSAESSVGGTGGIGAQTLITGTSQYFGGGGGGGAYLSGGGGGTGGGGTGNSTGPVAATPGTVNTGGGGGGSWQGIAAAGGSGIVFLSMPTIYYTGVTTGSPTVTTTGSNTVLRYTSSGTYTG